jgi:hypothetical protein
MDNLSARTHLEGGQIIVPIKTGQPHLQTGIDHSLRPENRDNKIFTPPPSSKFDNFGFLAFNEKEGYV